VLIQDIRREQGRNSYSSYLWIALSMSQIVGFFAHPSDVEKLNGSVEKYVQSNVFFDLVARCLPSTTQVHNCIS
jgi:hypothetical protein